MVKIAYDGMLQTTKQSIRMVHAKWVWLLTDTLGITISLGGILTNLDNIKSSIIAILAIIYLMLRIYFYFIKNNQSVKEKEIDLWHKEMDKEDRIKKRN